jgi:hypothetical protein
MRDQMRQATNSRPKGHGQSADETHVSCFLGDWIAFRVVTRGLRIFTLAAVCASWGSGVASAKSARATAAAKPAAPAAAKKPAPDPAPGARPEERNHLLEAKWAEVVVKGSKHGKEVVSAIKLVKPEIRLFHAAPPPEADQGQEAKDGVKATKDAKAAKDKEQAGRPPEEIIDLAQELRKITPLEVDHIDILDGQVAFVDTSRKERPEIWLHDLQLSVENLTTRVHMGEGRPVLLTASGTLARSGTVSLFITADPFEKGLTFSGRAAIVGLETSELYRFIEPATGMQAPHGTVDIFVEFDCRNGQLTGGVKPVLKNVEIRPASKNPFRVIEAWAADLAIKIFSDRVEQRNAIATVIPIKGTLIGPDIQLWPTIFGVMRNAFVQGLTSGYANLPPPTAPKKQGVLKQGVDSLTGSAPPKAQPTQQPDRAPPPPAASSSPTESKQSSPPASP